MKRLPRVIAVAVALALAALLSACNQPAPGTPVGQGPIHASTASRTATAIPSHSAKATPSHTAPSSLGVCPPSVAKENLVGISPPIFSSVINNSTIAIVGIGGADVWLHVLAPDGSLAPRGKLPQRLQSGCKVRGICRGTRLYAEIALWLGGGNKISPSRQGRVVVAYVDRDNLNRDPTDPASGVLFYCSPFKAGSI